MTITNFQAILLEYIGTAAAAAVEDHVTCIKELGRWSSDCYNRYIRTDLEVVKRALVQMSYF